MTAWGSSWESGRIEKDRNGSVQFVFVFLGLFISNVVSTILLVLTVRGWTGPYELEQFFSDNRSAVSIVVQILSHIFGFMAVRAICTALNLSARLRLATRSLSLETLKLVHAISGATLDLSLTGGNLVLLLAFVASSMIPAALWAGAITPISTPVVISYPISVPDYSNTSGTFVFNDPFSTPSNYTKISSLGTFTFSPAKQYSGFIIDNARNAINPSTGQVNSHGKLDRTGYVYTTRSFGVGTSVGMLDSFGIPATNYEYREAGFKVTTDCIYNDSALLFFEELTFRSEGFDFLVYNAVGQEPNGVSIENAVGAGLNSTVFSVSAGVNTTTDTTFVTMAAWSGNASESDYAALHHIQCQILYDPCELHVAVNVSDKTIQVTAPANESGAVTIPNEKQWEYTSAGMFSLISWTQVTTYLTSIMGDAFIGNIEAVSLAQLNASTNATNLYGVSSALESMFDSILETVSAAQMMVSNSTGYTTAQVYTTGFVFGTPVFTYAVAAVNALVTLVVLAEALRSRVWRGVPAFDYMDIKDVVLGASAPGNGISARAAELAGSGAVSAKDLGRIVLTVVNGSSLRVAGSDDRRRFDDETPLVGQTASDWNWANK
ncbi:hypothetical protein BX600DRAFT_534191 [Xylariales sp. PMI_506]|nr:hypothetical protein BX600DRAFT_534191 [Xylariales sp. PMI_506]